MTRRDLVSILVVEIVISFAWCRLIAVSYLETLESRDSKWVLDKKS